MSYPAPISIGSATTTTFLLTAETAIIIQSFSRKTDSKGLEIYDAALGYTTGEIYHDFKAEYDVKGRVAGSTGVMLAAPGVALSLANTMTGNGVTSGGIYTKSTSLDHSAEETREFSVSCKQLPGIS